MFIIRSVNNLNSKFKKLFANSGFSFIDVIVAIAITGIVATFSIPLVQSLYSINHYKTETSRSIAVLNNICEAVRNMAMDDILSTSILPYDTNYNYQLNVTVINKDRKNIEVVVYDKENKRLNSLTVLRAKISEDAIPTLVNVAIHADDHFRSYISSSPTERGHTYKTNDAPGDNWEPLWQFGDYLDKNLSVQYLHIEVWNDNGNAWGNRGFQAWLTLNHKYFYFPNGRQDISTDEWQYWAVSDSWFGTNEIVPSVIGGPYSGINLWYPSLANGVPFYFSMPIYTTKIKDQEL